MSERLARIEFELASLPALSESALQAFVAAEAGLREMVDEKLARDVCYSGRAAACGPVEVSADYQLHFGRLLRSVFEFNIPGVLAREFDWYVATMSNRGFGDFYFGKMLDAWIMALHARVGAADAREMVQPLTRLRGELSGFLTRPASSAPEPDATATQFLTLALEKRRRDAANLVLERFRARQSFTAPYRELVLPALQEIGRRWMEDRISAADEHAATEICRYCLLRLFDELPPEPARPVSGLVACVPGEEHELGAEVLANYLEARGWRSYFIGHSAPEADLVRTIRETRPDVVFLGVVLTENLSGARALLKLLRSSLPGSKIVIGGRAARIGQEVLKQHADAVVNDIEDACAAGEKLLGRNA